MIMAVAQSAFQIIFEVPSGVFADFFGMKKTLIISAVLRTLSFAMIYFGNSFLAYTTATSMFGVSIAFASGTDSAFIYDTLKDLRREKSYKKVWGAAYSYSIIGLGIAGFIGGFLAGISLELPVLASIISTFIALIISYTFVEPKHKRKPEDIKYVEHLKEAAAFSLRHPKVKWLIVFSGVVFAIIMASHKFIQPYMQMANIDISYFGAIYLIWLIFGAVVSMSAHSIEELIGEFWSLLIIPVMMAITLLYMGFFVSIAGVLMLFFGQAALGFMTPVIGDYINRHVESHHRATVLSLNGFFGSVMTIISAPIFGYIADIISLLSALLIMGISVFALGIPLALMIKFSNKKLNSTP